jgi:hypothetical protein
LKNHYAIVRQIARTMSVIAKLISTSATSMKLQRKAERSSRQNSRRSILDEIDSNHAEFTPRRGIIITADTVTVLLGHRTASSYPPPIAFGEFGRLPRVAGTWHGSNMWIIRPAPCRAAGKRVVLSNAARALDSAGLGRTKRA